MRARAAIVVAVHRAQLAVDLQERGEHVAVLGRRRRIQRRRVLQDFRHDPAQEPIVELDPALLERLLEDVVDERRARFVVGFVARERRDRRVQRLVVEQRKERRLQIAAERKPGYSIVADPDARPHVGRRGAIDDQFRSAVIDVVLRRDDGHARRVEPDLDVLAGRARQRLAASETTAAPPTTTRRAAPACSAGMLVLPSGRDTRRWLASIWVTVAPCVASSAKSGVVRPFCSSAIVSDDSACAGRLDGDLEVPV